MNSQQPTVSEPTATSDSQAVAEFWFDPLCPWAWMTSRWMLEVTRVREVRVEWHVMCLAYLNRDKDVPEKYRELIDKGWGPLRVIMAARARYGEAVVLPLYTAMGTHRHVRGTESFDDVITRALADCDLDADLATAAVSEEFDDEIIASHTRAIDLVGDEVGTPVISVEGVAFFGPVVTPAPKGEAAGRLWDGVLAVAGTPGFFELKRSRDVDPIFD